MNDLLSRHGATPYIELVITSHEHKELRASDTRRPIVDERTGPIYICRSSVNLAKNIIPRVDNAIFDSKVMSREHAFLTAPDGIPGPVYVTDTSKYGTYLNDVKVQKEAPILVKPGDMLRFGDLISTSSADLTHRPIEVQVKYRASNSRLTESLTHERKDQLVGVRPARRGYQAPDSDFSDNELQGSGDDFGSMEDEDVSHIMELSDSSSPPVVSIASNKIIGADEGVRTDDDDMQCSGWNTYDLDGEVDVDVDVFEEDYGSPAPSVSHIKLPPAPIFSQRKTKFDVPPSNNVSSLPVETSPDQSQEAAETQPNVLWSTKDIQFLLSDENIAEKAPMLRAHADTHTALKTQVDGTLERLAASAQSGQDSDRHSESTRAYFDYGSSWPVIHDYTTAFAASPGMVAKDSNDKRISINKLINPEARTNKEADDASKSAEMLDELVIPGSFSAPDAGQSHDLAVAGLVASDTCPTVAGPVETIEPDKQGDESEPVRPPRLAGRRKLKKRQKVQPFKSPLGRKAESGVCKATSDTVTSRQTTERIRAICKSALTATAYATVGSIATIGFLASPIAERLAGL